MNYTELDRRLVQVVPSPRQFAYQQLEFYAFVHFTVNTFTGREWGDGTEDRRFSTRRSWTPASGPGR